MDNRLDASRLESLLESARLLGSSLDLDQQINHLLRTVMGRLLATRALVALKQPSGYRIAAVRGLKGLATGDPITPDSARELGLSQWFNIDGQIGPAGFVAVNDPLGKSFDEGEAAFMEALLGLASAFISNARAHQEALRSNQELQAMLELSSSLAAAIEPEEVARLLMLTLAGRWALLKHGLVTWRSGAPPIRRLKGLEPPPVAELQIALKNRDHARCGDYLALPMRMGEELAGAVLLGPPASGRPMDGDDLGFAAGLVSLAAVALDKAWRIQDTLYRQRIERELGLAAAIQQDLFPRQLPLLDGTEMAARNRPAREVGGDYYDVLSVGGAGPSGPHLLCVADISGKGIGASLLMANIQATLRAMLSVESSLEEITRKTSDLLYASTPPSKYATAILVKYDPSTGACDYINAGHNEALIRRASGQIDRLDSTSVPLALFPARTYVQSSFSLGAGDTLLLYSDGVTDAARSDEEEFGIDRLIGLLEPACGGGPRQLVEKIFDAIDTFAAGYPQHDDITVMALRRARHPGVR